MEIAIVVILFIVVLIFLFPKGASVTGPSQPTYRASELLSAEPLPDEDDINARVQNDMNTKQLRKMEVANRLDQIANEPGGMMRFDKDGNGVIDSGEIRVARVEIALQIAAEKGELPEQSGVAAPVKDMGEDGSLDLSEDPDNPA